MEQSKGRQEEKEADNTFVLSAIMTDGGFNVLCIGCNP
jgi:hypothetical protein